MLYVTSDFHFYHKNMVRSLSNWDYTEHCRDFDSIDNMNESIIQSVNSTCTKSDTLLFLGDFAIYNVNNGKYNKNIHAILEKLNPNMIFLKGNHDDRFFHNFSLNESNGRWIFLNMDIFEFDYNDVHFVSCHYPLLSWNGAIRGAIMLHGHCHNYCVDPQFYKDHKIMDVYYEDRVFPITEIIDKFKNKDNNFIM